MIWLLSTSCTEGCFSKGLACTPTPLPFHIKTVKDHVKSSFWPYAASGGTGNNPRTKLVSY